MCNSINKNVLHIATVGSIRTIYMDIKLMAIYIK